MDELTRKAIAKTQMAEGLRRTAYELWEQGRIDNKGLGQRLEDIKRRYALTPAEQQAFDALERNRKAE